MIEQNKYEKMWDIPQYRDTAPGEFFVDHFIKTARPKPTDTIIDFGCGTGRAALTLSKFAKVRMLDFTANSLDDSVREALGENLTFEQHDLTKAIPGKIARLGYNTDVMEHIPPDDVKKVLANILLAAKYVYFNISTVPDNMGALIGEQLHLTVQPYSWWLEQFNDLGCSVINSSEHESCCIFFVTGYVNGKVSKDCSSVNTEDDVMVEQIVENLKLGLDEAKPYETQDKELIFIAGGPSINEYVQELKLNKKLGVPIVTFNGSYNWAIENGIKPDVQVVMDAREFNSRFVDPIIPSCKYLIASQCHPELVKKLPKEQTILWHSGADNVKKAVRQLGIERDIYPVYGGMTVMLRAFSLFLMLGYSKFAVYGFDSCIMDNHHGYPQPENDSPRIFDVECGDRVFKCHPWMLSQAHEFLELQEMISELVQMDIKGDGLIAHMIKTGAKLSELDNSDNMV